MKNAILTLTVLLSLLLLASSGVSAQSDSTNSTFAGPSADREFEMVIDDDVGVTSWSYDDGEFVVWFYADSSKTVTVASNPDSGSDQGSITFRSVAVKGEARTKMTVASDGPITLWTEDSVEENQAYYLKPGGDLVSGPYSGSDVRDAAVGGALAVVIAVLYEAVAAKISATNRGERVA